MKKFVSNDPLRRFYDDCLDRKISVKSEREAEKFFNALFNFNDKLDALFSLTDTGKDGTAVLRKAFALTCTDVKLVNSSVIKFFEFLGDDDINRGAAKDCASELFLVDYETPRFLDNILIHLLNRLIDKPIVVSWYLLPICRARSDCRENENVIAIAKILKELDVQVSQLFTLLFPQLHPPNEVNDKNLNSLEEMLANEPQHDNDFAGKHITYTLLAL